jgi:iron complex outermembrane receptor protein
VASDNGGSLSGRANLAYQFTDALMSYVSYAYGYKSGGLNMSGLPLDAVNQPALATAVIEDERNKTFELGLKASLLDGRATLNLAAFHTVVEDYQSNIVSSLETAAIRSYPSNIPEVKIKGAEMDLAAVLFRGFTLRASAAYALGVDADYANGPCPLEVQTAATVACNLTGKRLGGLSRWVGSLGFDYVAPAGDGQLVVHGDMNARSRYNSDMSLSRYTWIGGYGVVNASVGYQFSKGWSIDVFARNLLDKDYITALTIQTGNSGLILGQPSDPRLMGVRIRTQF